jgi:hypothetical protein
MDYSFDYNGDSYRIPKAKIFDCLFAIGEVESVANIGSSMTDAIKAAKIFCILSGYANKQLDPMDVSRRYLYEEGGANEIFNAVGGLVALLAPPETYHPPESDDAGK